MVLSAKEILLNPYRLAVELGQNLLKSPQPGAPSAWTPQMTIIFALLPFVIVLLHFWDAQIVLAARDSRFILMEWLRVSTDASRALVWFIIASMTWIFTAFLLYPDSRWRHQEWVRRANYWATLILLSIFVAGIPVKLGKLAIGRARPYLLDTFGPSFFAPFNGTDFYQSFPSGHSMMAGIMMMTLWIFFPFLRVVAAVLCLAFAGSRLAVGAHYPTDVVVGFTIGLLATWWVVRYMAVRNIIFLIEGGKTVPSLYFRRFGG